MFNDKNIPNVFTCLNLLCGCIAIVSVFHGNVILVASMIFLAAIFDFMDGITARALNAFSDLGKQLDSLADMVSFGVAPGMILYSLMINRNPDEMMMNDVVFGIVKYFPFIVTVVAAFRLAKFNNDQRQSSSFLGLPTPAMGIFVTAFPLIIKFDQGGMNTLLSNPYFIIIISIILSVLMISEIPLFALKFKNMKWNDNKIQFIFIILSILLFAFLRFTAIPLIIFLYIILSVINHYFFNIKRDKHL